MTLMTIFVIALLGQAHPLKAIASNYTNIRSEAIILLIVDLLLFSSDPSLEPNNRQFLGFMIVAVIVAFIIIREGSLLIKSCKTLKLECKKRAFKKRI